MDFARIGLCLCASSARYGERCNDKSNRRPARRAHKAHCFIGSHWRATLGAVIIDGAPTDFLGQYHRNSSAILKIRYSF